MSESEVVGRENGRRAVTWALVAGACLVLAVPVAVKAGATRAYVAPSSSMAPTIQIGDRFLVELKHGGQSPHRGELWVMRDPALIGRSATYVKRIVGLPGETIEIRGAVVKINAKPVSEPYLKKPGSYTTPTLKLGPGQYYMLGDNRDNSNDSHIWGPLPEADLIGRAEMRYWPLERLGAL